MNRVSPRTKDDRTPPNPPDERVGEIPLLPTAVWIGSYLLAAALQKYLNLPGALKVSVALIPVLPFVFFVRRFLAHLRKLDELHRRIHFEALAFAFPLTILLLMTLGLLERTRLLNPQNWSYGQVWFCLPLFYLIGMAFSWRRYR